MVSNINIDDWCPRPFIADIPTLHPKEEELRDFNRFMQNAIVDLRSSCGLIKIIPPKNWTKDLSKIENFNLSFQTTRQKRNGKDGIFSLHQSNDQKLDFHDFKQFALDFDSKHARVSSAQIFERKFWKKIHSIVPVQAVESNSLFNSNIKTFNLNNLKTILDLISKRVDGVHRPYLYIGTSHSSFGFQVEDMNLYSIYYLHTGNAKIWYSIPTSAAHLFEKLTKNYFPRSSQQCSSFLLHKNILIAPYILEHFKIPYARTIQNEGEFIVTLPASYHQAYNMGFNFCESVNFALPNWIPYGISAPKCMCRKGNFNFDMRIFQNISAKHKIIVDWDSYRPFEYSPSDDICIKNKTILYFDDNIHFKFADILVVWLPFGKSSLMIGHYDPILRANDYLSDIPPFCSLCLLFSFKSYKETSIYHNGIYVDQTTFHVPEKCTVHTQMPLFSKLKYLDSILPSSSGLLKCSQCHVTVHNVCIGFPTGEQLNIDWKCDYCLDHQVQPESPKCEFCPVRIGILKRIGPAQYAHVACLIMAKPVTKKICTFCFKYSQRGRMASCSTCKKLFHVYCGHFNGVWFLQENWPKVLRIQCQKCREKFDKKILIPTGSRVSLHDDRAVMSSGTVLSYRHPHAVIFKNYEYSYDVDDNDIWDDENLRMGKPSILAEYQGTYSDALYIGKMEYACYRVLLDSGKIFLYSPEEIVSYRAPEKALVPCVTGPVSLGLALLMQLKITYLALILIFYFVSFTLVIALRKVILRPRLAIN